MRRWLLILLLAAASARADTVRLKNGNVLEGTVIEENAAEVKVRTATTELTVPRAQVAEIEKGEAPLDAYKRRAAALGDNDAGGHYALALFCLDGKLLTQAMAELRRVLELNKDHAEARAKLTPLLEQRAAPLLARARKLQEQGDYDEAEQPLITILEQYPDWPQAALAQHYLAVGFAAQKQYDMALTRWRRALALDPKLVEAAEGAAHASAEMGKWDDALAFTDRAIEGAKDPAAADRLRKRAEALRELVKLQKDADPKKPDPARFAAEGRVLLQLGQRERGLNRLQDAYDAGARDPNLVKTLAEYNEQHGRILMALELYKDLAAANPRDDDLARRRTQIEKLLLIPTAFETHEKARRDRILFDVAKSGATFDYIEAALRESADREPQKTGLVEGSFLVDEVLTTSTYAAYVPKAYDPRRPWPLILAFHRDGESGKEHFYNWETAAATDRYILMLPNSPRKAGDWKFAHLTLALSALHHAVKTYNIDTNRVYIAGTGSGGLLAWSTALRHPDLFAALVVRNAVLDEVSRMYLRAAASLPTYLACSVQGSPEVVGSMREAATAMERWSYDVLREEVPGYTRNPSLPELNRKILGWLDDKRRDPYASRARLVSFEFSNADAYWLRVEKFASTIFDPDRKINIKAPFGQQYTAEQLRLIYLGEMGKAMGQVAGAIAPGNRIRIITRHIDELTVFLDDKMVDLDKPVRIYVNGELAFSGKVERSLEQLFDSARYKRDPRLCYSAAVKVKCREK